MSIQNIAPFSANELEETVGGILGLMVCIPQATDALSIGNDQLGVFCRNTPNGEELWVQFSTRRDSEETSADYNFVDFMREVLAEELGT